MPWRKQSRTLATIHTGPGATRPMLLDHAWSGHACAAALRPKLDNAGAGATLVLRRAPVSRDC